MDLLRIVVKKRSENTVAGAQDRDSMSKFSSRVAKLHGEGPMATSMEPEVTLEVVSINISDIEIPPNYSRESMGDLAPLVASIKSYGIQQPIKVVKIRGSKKFRLVFGRRRLRASQMAGFDAVPCIVELVTKEDRLQMLSLAENLHRSDLTPLEQANTFKYMQKKQGITLKDLSETLCIPIDTIKDLVCLLDLPESVRNGVLENSQQFTLEILKVLGKTFQLSPANGQKMFQSILSGDITSRKEAEEFLTR